MKVKIVKVKAEEPKVKVVEVKNYNNGKKNLKKGFKPSFISALSINKMFE